VATLRISRVGLLVTALAMMAVLFAGLWLGSVIAPATDAATFSGTKVTKFDAVDGGGNGCLSNSPWSDLAGAKKTVQLGGTVNRPVLVTFSAQVYYNTTTPVVDGEFRLMVDGFVQGVGPLTVEHDPGGYPVNEPISYTFLTPSLAPGAHTIKMQWEGFPLCVQHWTLAIMHA